MKSLRVAFICSEVSGVSFYRVYQPARAMESKRTEVLIYWYSHDQYLRDNWELMLDGPDGDRVRYEIEIACDVSDAVVWMGLHNDISLGFFTAMRMRYPDKPFIMELDDYVLSIPEANIASTVYRPGSGITQVAMAQMKMSDALVVSTPSLKDLYAPFKSKIYVVENAIDLRLWRGSYPTTRQGLTLGWVGGGTHDDDLRLVKDVVFDVLEKNPSVTFSVMHGCPEFFKHHKQIKHTRAFRPINTYPKWVVRAGFDIGIAPLLDNNFNRGKSNLRWLEYSAMGVPCVASPLPHFRESIEHGRTGLLAHTESEWREHLQALIDNHDLRLQMGREAKQEVREKWNPNLMAKKYKKVFEDILNAKTDTVTASAESGGPYRGPQQHAVVNQ